MSLLDQLNGDTIGSTQISLMMQQVASQLGTGQADTTASALSKINEVPIVQISEDAQRAQAESAEANLDAGELSEALRNSLDERGTSAVLPKLSARSLSIIGLNQDGTFSKAESARAKAELRERDRVSVVAFLQSGALTAASLKTFSQQLMSARSTMSSEELQLRDIDPALR